jgi:hypothetical protein
MTTAEQVRADERAAREKVRRARHAQRVKAHVHEREVRAELRTRQREAGCRCSVESLDPEYLIGMGAGCKAGSGYRPGYVCPTLNWLRLRLGAPFRRGAEKDRTQGNRE